jgi:hypothetical protein
MAAAKLFADVLQEFYDGKRTGALFVSAAEASENLIRFYFKEGNISNLSYGTAKDKDCLDILDCYELGKAIYFDGMKAPGAPGDLPPTEEIIANARKSGKMVELG